MSITNWKPFSIKSLAQPGETWLTQFVVRPDQRSHETREAAEATIRARYPQYTIRFHYGVLEYNERSVSSKEFGAKCVTGDVAAVSFGGAAFGTPKNQ